MFFWSLAVHVHVLGFMATITAWRRYALSNKAWGYGTRLYFKFCMYGTQMKERTYSLS